MRIRLEIASIVGACLGCIIASMAAAQVSSKPLYWCEFADGRTALIQNKPDDAICQLVSSGIADAPQKQTSREGKTSQRAAEINPERPLRREREQDGTLIEFPVITADETVDRDELRQWILLDELEAERRSVEGMRNYLGSRNLAELSNESKEYYRRRLQGHLHNIRSLQQELARLE